MSYGLQVKITSFAALREMDEIPKQNKIAAQRAINLSLRKERTRSSRAIREQINFKASDLVGRDGKIDMIPATGTNLEGTLAASSRAKSLASFLVSFGRKLGARVKVNPNGIAKLPGAFLIGVGGNQLLVVRGKRPSKAYKPTLIGKNLWVLYGPSVAQALINADGKGIWPQHESAMLDDLENEYLRQMKIGVPNG